MSNQNDKWRKFDIVWMLNLFGTAVGAGVLFCQLMPGWEDSGH